MIFHILAPKKKKYENIKAVFFELINKEDKERGTKLLRSCVEKCKTINDENSKVRTLIAGGDGTVLTMIEGFQKDGIDINYCIFGHIPLGTGNDLSNSLGFNSCVDISDNIDKLYKIILKYFHANFGKIDVWNMDLILHENDGEVLLNTKNGKKQLLDDNGQILRRYKRTFINYLSLGYDARIGYNFDPKRTKSRNHNKCVYFWEGLKKLLCRKTLTVQHFIDTFTVFESPENSVNESTFWENQNNPENEKVKFQFRSKYSKTITNAGKELVIKGDPCSIIFQNIIMYMSGITDIWGNAKLKRALTVEDEQKQDKQKYVDKIKKMDSEIQRSDDKQLEVFTFDNGLETGFEKVRSGHAKKLYHGRGPMEIKFLDTPGYTKGDTKDRIYLNVDGEYFHIVRPIQLRIEISRGLCGGQLPFLVNK